MYSIFSQHGNALERRFRGELLRIEPWGEKSFRVRATCLPQLQPDNWALDNQAPAQDAPVCIRIDEQTRTASITYGTLRAEIDPDGVLSFWEQDRLLLKEYDRHRNDLDRYCSPLNISSREFSPLPGGDWGLTVRFEGRDGEKIYGMGQYQHGYLDQKGCTLELAHRNTQCSVPFAVSSLGYGFLWNNPAIGSVTFGKNQTEWKAQVTRQMDYWLTAGETPAEIEERYASLVGKAPMMPEYGLGFWQCKLRYQTQEELLSVAREYKRRGIPVNVIVIDFFHWTNHGEWKFDPVYWPDPEGMIRELKEMGILLMVSVWPTVAKDSENYEEMAARDLLVRSDRGLGSHMEFLGNTVFFDATNPEARAFIWEKVKKNYYEKGVKIFWLDEAEPEYGPYDFDIFRYHDGPALRVSNEYPKMFARAFYEGMQAEGQENIVNLLRCAWVGSQKYGALVWSGDVDSSFRALREQLSAGLNMGMAGIPWWTTDIGGFLGGNPDDPDFRECLVRWFQFGTFSPVMRLHGERVPHRKPLSEQRGGGQFFSGADNEIWSFGEENTPILEKYIFLREAMRPYTRLLMQQAHEAGTPVMRTLFYMYPDDPTAWEIQDEYLFGGDVLVAPILFEGQRSRRVYLPGKDTWKNAHTGESFAGGQWVEAEAPLDVIPVFLREGGAADFTL
ncbi:MAG: TIM-barrel domain-containing protein [Candidatus Heritagella sp.]